MIDELRKNMIRYILSETNVNCKSTHFLMENGSNRIMSFSYKQIRRTVLSSFKFLSNLKVLSSLLRISGKKTFYSNLKKKPYLWFDSLMTMSIEYGDSISLIENAE